MRHVACGLVVASLALALGCGANGQEAVPTGQAQPAGATTVDLTALSQFVPRRERAATIVVRFVDRDDVCQKTEPIVAGITVKNRHVNWHVLNECKAQDVRASVANFQIKPAPGGEAVNDNPFSSGNPDCVALAGRHCTISMTVRDTPPEGTRPLRPDESVFFVYTYEFRVDGKPIDPELIIEWF